MANEHAERCAGIREHLAGLRSVEAPDAYYRGLNNAERRYVEDVTFLLSAIDDYESAITWGLTCLNCSNLMDKNYEQYVRLDMIKTALAGKFYIPSQYKEDAIMYAEPVRAALEDDLG